MLTITPGENHRNAPTSCRGFLGNMFGHSFNTNSDDPNALVFCKRCGFVANKPTGRMTRAEFVGHRLKVECPDYYKRIAKDYR